MYVLNQRSTFSDEIVLQKNDGTQDTIKYSLPINEETLKKYRTLQIKLIDFQRKCKSDPKDITVIESAGKIIVELLCVIFGDENAKKLIDFYSNDYPAMMSDLFPYIQNTIVPELNKVAKSRKKGFKSHKLIK